MLPLLKNTRRKKNINKISGYDVDDEDKLTGFGKDIYFFEDGTVVFWNIPGTDMTID